MELKELQDAAARLFNDRTDVKTVSLWEDLDAGKRVVTMKVYFPSASEWSIATQVDTSAQRQPSGSPGTNSARRRTMP